MQVSGMNGCSLKIDPSHEHMDRGGRQGKPAAVEMEQPTKAMAESNEELISACRKNGIGIQIAEGKIRSRVATIYREGTWRILRGRMRTRTGIMRSPTYSLVDEHTGRRRNRLQEEGANWATC